MKTKKVIILSGSVLSIVLILAVLSYMQQPTKYTGIDFTYSDSQTIKTILHSKNIFMSSPTKISDYTVKQYCMYFDDQNKQQIMNECVTTSLTDPDGNPLGNINIGGRYEKPLMAVAIVESSPLLDSQKNNLVTVFEAMISTLVCDCWEEKQPGGFGSLSQWIQATENHHVNSGRDSTKSKISGFEGKEIILEISKADDSYLWTLIIIK